MSDQPAGRSSAGASRPLFAPGAEKNPQGNGEVLPLAHFLRVVRGTLLQGGGWVEI